MKLKVMSLPVEDTWKDIVRIDKHNRKDFEGKHINRGSICRLCLGNKSKWVVVHGRKTVEPVIQMDLNMRLQLDVTEGEAYDLTLRKMSWLRSLWFPWKASDPLFRLPAQISLISFGLGLLALILAIPPSWDWMNAHFRHQSSASSAAPTPAAQAPEAAKPEHH